MAENRQPKQQQDQPDHPIAGFGEEQRLRDDSGPLEYLGKAELPSGKKDFGQLKTVDPDDEPPSDGR